MRHSQSLAPALASPNITLKAMMIENADSNGMRMSEPVPEPEKNTKRPCCQPNGFTLVEFLLYTGLLAIILAILTTMFTSLTDIQLDSESSSALAQDEAFIVNRLNYDIRRASAIVLPAAAGGSGSILQLQIDGSTHQYAVAGGNLILTAGTSQLRVNSEGTTVQAATFQRLGNQGGYHTIRYTITIASTATIPGESGPRSRTLSATVALR